MDVNQFLGTALPDYLASGVISAIIAIGIIVAVIFFFALYIYFALAWKTIATRQKYKRPWLAWIPFANFGMIFQLGGWHWAWVFTIFFPPVFFVLMIVATWKIFEKHKYPGWFSLSVIIPKVGVILYLVAIGFLAWQPKGLTRKSKLSKKKAKKRK
jgi:hypothetical protein